MMEAVVKNTFVSQRTTINESLQSLLDNEEVNALHYTAGYVVHAIAKDILHLSVPNKTELLVCLGQMIKGKAKT